MGWVLGNGMLRNTLHHYLRYLRFYFPLSYRVLWVLHCYRDHSLDDMRWLGRESNVLFQLSYLLWHFKNCLYSLNLSFCERAFLVITKHGICVKCLIDHETGRFFNDHKYKVWQWPYNMISTWMGARREQEDHSS